MEVVYYRTKYDYIPVKEFLLRYYIDDKDDQKTKDGKVRNLNRIRNVIKSSAENEGRPIGEFSSPESGYKFSKFTIHENNKLQVRIPYFCYHKEKLVLLNGYEKPKLYEKGRAKKERLRIKKINQKTQEYYNDFIDNPNHYERYQ